MRKADCHCPHCNANIYVYEPIGEDEEYETECSECGKSIYVTASSFVSYTPRCADADHDIVDSEEHPGWVSCLKCDLFVKREKIFPS